MSASHIGQWIFNVTSGKTSESGCTSKIRTRARRALLRNNRLRTLPISYRLHDVDLMMPLAHALPSILSSFIDYGENLGRIAKIVRGKYPTAPILDIGANIGDSAAIIRHYAGPVATLCIEPSEEYFPYLLHNAAAIGPEVKCLKAAVDASSGVIQGHLSAVQGTAQIKQSSVPESMAVLSIEHIVDLMPQFAEPGLIKIDTDGFDERILCGAATFIERVHPVLFWEFDPSLDAASSGPGAAVFSMLANAGYVQMTVYTNTGDYLTTISLQNHDILSDIVSFFSGRKSFQYADLCAFPESDTDLALALRDQELMNAKQLRGF